MTDISPKSERAAPAYSQADWEAVSDNPDLTEAEIAELRPAREIAEIFDLLPKRGRGRPKRPDAKVNLTLRVEPDVIASYKATGRGWQTRMGEALAKGLLPLSEGRADSEGDGRPGQSVKEKIA